MNTHTHFYHAEDSILMEHRLIFQVAAEAPPEPEKADAPGEAPPVGADNPAGDAKGAGVERKGDADDASEKAKKEKAAVDIMAENLGIKMEKGADEIENKTDVMAKVKTDLLATLREGLGGEKRTKPPEKIAEDIQRELAKIPFNPETDNLMTYLDTVKAKADELLRSHPDIVAATSAVDAEKGVETPLTPQELGEAKKLLSDGTLKTMQEFLAKENKDVQRSLAKLWLGAQGFSVDDSVTELKVENLTIENMHKVEGMGQLINMAVLAFTVLHLLKQKTEELKKTVTDGVNDATGEGTPEGSATPEAGEETADTSGISEERKQELLNDVKGGGIGNMIDSRKQDVDVAKNEAGSTQNAINLLTEKAAMLEAQNTRLKIAPEGENDADRTARTTDLAQNESEIAKTRTELQVAQEKLAKEQEKLQTAQNELDYLKEKKSEFKSRVKTFNTKVGDSLANLIVLKDGGSTEAEQLWNILDPAVHHFRIEDERLSMTTDDAWVLTSLKTLGNTMLGNIPSSEEIGIDPATNNVTNMENITAFLTMLTKKIEEGEAPKAS